MHRKLIHLSLLALLASCIGIDEVDDPIIGESISIIGSQRSLLIGDTLSLTAEYKDRYGIPRDLQPVWLSTNPEVVSVSPFGLITALTSGQSEIIASVGTTISLPVLVTAVGSSTDIAQISISSAAGTQIGVGQQSSLTILITDLQGNTIEGLDVLWESSHPEVLAIDQEGNMSGLNNGVSKVKAFVNGLMSNELTIIVGTTSRTGTFQGANGYNASGTTNLFFNAQGQLMLSLSSNFSTDFALGTFIYLSNSTSGSATGASGVELQGITAGGAHTFNVAAIDPEIGINDYQYVIVLCKPASITFGFAQLN